MEINLSSYLYLMLKWFLFFNIILNAVTGFSQKVRKKEPLPPPPPVLDETIRSSFTKVSFEERIAFYPFNESVQLKIVSFGLNLSSENKILRWNLKLPIENDTVSLSQLDQVKILTLEIDILTDILYNECHRWSFRIFSRSACFYPRHAILFYDKEGKVIDYIEICFECSGIKLSNKAIKEPEECDIMYKQLEDLFKKIGLKTKAID